jgi:hypothetical protein
MVEVESASPMPFVFNPKTGEVGDVEVQNLSVSLNEWAAMWPEDIFFFAHLSTEGI